MILSSFREKREAVRTGIAISYLAARVAYSFLCCGHTAACTSLAYDSILLRVGVGVGVADAVIVISFRYNQVTSFPLYHNQVASFPL